MKLLWLQPMSRNKNVFWVLRCTCQSHRDPPCRPDLQTDSHFSEHNAHQTLLSQFSVSVFLETKDLGSVMQNPTLLVTTLTLRFWQGVFWGPLCPSSPACAGQAQCVWGWAALGAWAAPSSVALGAGLLQFILAKLIPQTRLSDTSWEIHTWPHPDKLWKPKTATRWQPTAGL